METLLLLRKTRGLTQKTVADALGISRQAYANYETGNREPDLTTLKTLADFFGVTVDYLLGKDEISTPEQVEIARKNGAALQEIFNKGSDEGYILAIVFDNKEDANEDYAPLQCFWIKLQELYTFLNICKENKKYVQLEFNFAEEGTDGEKNS